MDQSYARRKELEEREREHKAKAAALNPGSWSARAREAAQVDLPDTPTQQPFGSTVKTPASGRTAYAFNWTAGAFSRPGMETPAKSPGGGDGGGDNEDFAMESVAGQSVVSGDTRFKTGSAAIVNAPNLAAPPVYSGATMEERRIFMDQYNTYLNSLKAYEASGTKVFVHPVAACIEERTRWRIAMYDIQKELPTITEDDWKAYFLTAFEEERLDYDAVDAAMKKLRMDTRQADAASRVGRLVKDMHAILHKTGVELTMTRSEPRKLVQYLVDALEPPRLKEKIKQRLAQERNKPLRGNLPAFTKWLETAIGTFIYWEDAADSKPGAGGPQAKGSGSGGKSNGGKQNGGRGGGGSGPATTPPSSGGQSHEGPAKKGSAPHRFPCLKCGSVDHQVRKCPDATQAEVEKLLAEVAAKKAAKGGPKVGRLGSPGEAADPRSSEEHAAGDAALASRRDRGTAPVTLAGVPTFEALVDTGADVSLVSRGVVDAMERAGVFVEIARVENPQVLQPIGKGRVTCKSKVRLRNLSLATSMAPLVLPCVEAWIEDDDKSISLILGRPELQKLGYTTDKLLLLALRSLGATPVTGEVGDWAGRGDTEDEKVPSKDEQPTPFKMGRLRAEQVRAQGEDADERDELMAFPDPKPANMEDVARVLEKRYQDALKRGLPPGPEAAYLAETLKLTVQAFRLTMGTDPPVKVEPLRVRLKPGAVPTRCHLHRLPPLHSAYLKDHLMALLASGCVRRNTRSRWASPPRVVPKHDGSFRMVVDVRKPNDCTEPMLWPMPIMEVLLTFVVASICYYQLDGDKMFWQLPLHPLSQELFTIMTAYGMFSPTRVLMGQTDAPAFCQQTMEKIFASQLHEELLVWMDDLLGHAPTPMRLMENLRRTLLLCIEHGVKINPTKCIFFTREASWCGRVISAAGVGHSPERIAGLAKLPSPKTGADLQQFLCAVNWMRMSIPNYTTIVAPLMALLDAAAKECGSRKKRKLARIELWHGLWEAKHEESYGRVRDALSAISPLAHPDAKAIVCVFTDASQDHWGAAVTQIKPGQDLSVITEAEHAPLAFLSGSFVDSASRWPIVEKEAFAIVETCKRLEYLLLREGGFRLYTDHRNLVYIFDPHATDANMARYQADKLQRWSMTMMMFRYSIWHIAGEDNVWGDLLSRWGAKEDRGPVNRVRALAVVDAISPLQVPDFQWPSMEEVLTSQQTHLKARDPTGTLPDVIWSEDVHAYVNEKGQVWVPSDDVDLQQRLMVVAHAGAAGHRGQAVTLKNVQDVFTWTGVAQDVKTFVNGCLHCMTVRGEKIPRPFGEALHATKPNEVIHFDFLSMPLGNETSKYVLVLKDDMSGFVELIECETADSDEVLQGLLDWFKRFGIVDQWVSDRGSHFKNAVIEDLRKILGSQHHFVTAYCPWANGTVEVVNNMLLRVVKALMSELKLKPSEWPSVLPVVQAALNSAPSDRLGGVAPLTAFTQLPATTPLSALIHPKTKTNVTVEWVRQEHARYLREASEALDGMHKTITAEAEKKRLQARARQGAKPTVTMPEFDVGDFVLVGIVLSHANKLALRWRGPRRIVKVVYDRIFEVENLVPPYETTTHHASRLQWYADSKRGVTEDLLEQARHSEGGHLVEKILDSRTGPETHQPEMQVRWVGLDPLEATWEVASELIKDVPTIVQRYIDGLPQGQKRKDLEAVVTRAAIKAKTKATKAAKAKAQQQASSTRKPAKKGGGK